MSVLCTYVPASYAVYLISDTWIVTWFLSIWLQFMCAWLCFLEYLCNLVFACFVVGYKKKSLAVLIVILSFWSVGSLCFVSAVFSVVPCGGTVGELLLTLLSLFLQIFVVHLCCNLALCSYVVCVILLILVSCFLMLVNKFLNFQSTNE